MWCGGGNDHQEAKGQRASVAEWTNAQVRLSLGQFATGACVTSVMLLVAVAHNFLRCEALMG